MAVFAFKVLSISIKTLARPLINWLTYYNTLRMQESQSKTAVFLRNRLVWVGQTINHYNILLNRKIFGLTKETSTIKALTADKAMERGAEFFSEIIVYAILLTIPIYEMFKSYRSSVQKEQQKKDYIIQMQNDVDLLIERNLERGNNVQEIIKKVYRINNNLQLV